TADSDAPTIETVAAEVEQAAAARRLPTTVVFGRKERYDAFAASRAVLAGSGTVALEAMAGLLLAIAYLAAPAMGLTARRLVRIPHVFVRTTKGNNGSLAFRNSLVTMK